MKQFCFILLIFLLVSCKKEDDAKILAPVFMETPKGFEIIEDPEDNVFSQDRWDLGKKLFFDPVLSRDSTMSCASCHKSALAFSDDVAFSLGIEDRPGIRNSPSLANIKYHPYFTREGGVPTLEQQILVPIQEHNEFDFNIVLIAERLNEDASYVSAAQKAYDRNPDAFTITRALACFERSLMSGFSRYDQYQNYGDKEAMAQSELRGLDLFNGEKTNCTSCHSGFNFTNYAFENNGLYAEYVDEGRFRLTGLESDRALFKVPSLRNVGVTAPFMHDGSMSSLEEVVEHYNTGGFDHPNKNEILQPLDLSAIEKDDLVAFLRSLTDEHFINNPLFKN